MVQNCTKIEEDKKWKMNANFEFRFDTETGRIYQDISGTEDYCVSRNKKNAYVSKCQKNYENSDVVKENEQFRYLSESGAILSKEKERRLWRAMYFDKLVDA